MCPGAGVGAGAGVKLRDFALFTDQNINRLVVAELRAQGFDVVDVKESRWHGRDDAQLLAQAVADGRVLVTHDADFGELVVLYGEVVVGVVYLRPGHRQPPETIDTVRAVLARDPDVSPPFLLVARWANGVVTVRVRDLTPGP